MEAGAPPAVSFQLFPDQPAHAPAPTQIPTDAPEWSQVYDEPQRPLVLDLGCGYGRFLLALT